GEQLELKRAKFDGAASAANFTTSEVHFGIAKPKDFELGLASAPQGGLDAGTQLPGTERLSDVIVSPQFKAHYLFRLLSLGGQKNDGGLKSGASQFTANFETV